MKTFDDFKIEKALNETVDGTHGKTLQKIVDQLQILSRETEELQHQWVPLRANSISRMLKANASLLDMLISRETWED